MQTHLDKRTKHLLWLRLGFVAVLLLGVITLLLMTNSEPVEAAPELTLQPRDLLIVTPEGCNLKIMNMNATKTRARLECEAFTSTANAVEIGASGLLDSDEDLDGMTSDVVYAPDVKIYRTIKPGKKLIVLATLNMCKLKVVEETASLVRIKCKPTITPTPTATATRTMTSTPSSTPRPALANLYLRNQTGGTLCYEVYNTGIGRKCFGGGDSFYGGFTPGTYTYKVEAVCGSLTDSFNLAAGNWVQTWGCNGILGAEMSQGSPHSSDPNAFATPSR